MEETLEEAIERQFPIIKELKHSVEYKASIAERKLAFIFGAKWQQKRSYSEEEVLELLKKFDYYPTMYKGNTESEIKEWFEQFKKK